MNQSRRSQWIEAVMADPRLDAETKAVALALAKHMDEDGVCRLEDDDDPDGAP